MQQRHMQPRQPSRVARFYWKRGRVGGCLAYTLCLILPGLGDKVPIREAMASFGYHVARADIAKTLRVVRAELYQWCK